MNTKIAVAILAVACIGFAVALVALKHQADAQQTVSASTINEFSNQIVKDNISIEDLNQANLNLRNDLATNRQMSLALSNQLAANRRHPRQHGGLAPKRPAANHEPQRAHRRFGGPEPGARPARQFALQHHRRAGLANQFTQMKLAASETNNEFLDNELKQQIAERAELERKFNDLVEVRAQVRKLRDDLFIARRLEWMREGVDPTKLLKGGQLLMQRSRPPPTPRPPPVRRPTT